MALSNLTIEIEYRTLLRDIAKEFIVPALRESILYERAVGYFSSSILSSISYGIEGLVKNGGKIKLVASPHLSKEDVEAIRIGYKKRDDVIKEAVKSTLKEPINEFEQERLNLLANLISDGYLDIKIAFCEDSDNLGMYHEKLGIISDSDGNMVAFSGSMNETSTGLNSNYETIDVFRSWKNEYEYERAKLKKNAFISIWNNTEPCIKIIDFPELKDEIIDRYKKDNIDYINFTTKFPLHDSSISRKNLNNNLPCRPEKPQFYDYQEDAICKWKQYAYRGIFDMATGTGKTFTGLGAMVSLSDYLNGHLAVIIVCPYQHLVEQWVEDIVKFNIKPIIGYSASPQKGWRKKLENAIRNQKLSIKGKEFFCFICTNATYSSDYVQEQLNKIHGDCLLLVDEAHNFGSRYLSRLLNENFKYRLALSATLDRYGDDEGTKKLYDYFGEKCISYDLGRAIKEGKLTRYKYYPIVVNLNDDELNRYIDLSRAIQKCIQKTKNNSFKLSEQGKRLAMSRARIVAAAENKIAELAIKIKPYIHEHHILVYCGTASLPDYNRDISSISEEDIRQIDAVTDLLGNTLGMRVSQFTSKEDISKRELIKAEFASGDNLQALVAIKCLDEGVNIPSIKTAFILASTTNPKEYIQRRGRVLRLYKGKQFAEIYDFICLPVPLGSSIYMTEDLKKLSMAMVKNEIARAFEFARLADNFTEANIILDKVREEYALEDGDYSFVEEFDYYE